MRVLLLSTYELGHQPLGIAGPAAALEAAGHQIFVADLGMQEWPSESVADAEAAVISVPMHTATQLALPVIARLRAERPGLRLALHGLYAPVLAGHDALEPGDLLVAGDPVPSLLAWLEGSRPGGLVTDLGSPRAETVVPSPVPPRRVGLPSLDRYTRLLNGAGGIEVTAGSTEASRGCNHRCRHCPVAAVYGGRSRPVPIDTVLADIAQLAGAGAMHVSFADPDFLNRPRHALEVARRLHSEHGEVTFDATVKVEHICRHAGLFEELASCGLLFVLSAFESVDDGVLARLDKGHSAAEEAEAIHIVRSAGIELRPSWLPFSPWTTLGSVGDLLTFSARHDLVWSTDPVQYTIRLLLPKGSLLLEAPDEVLRASLRPESPGAGSVPWASQDPALDALQQSMASLVEEADSRSLPPDETFLAIWQLVRGAGADLPEKPPAPADGFVSALAGTDRPHLSESWFCCAEPTSAQLGLVALA